MGRITRALRYHLERWLQRGAFHQLLFAAALIALVSALGGLVAWAASDKIDGPLQGIWWSFLRLSDPGYLGDDEGVALRVVSTIVTVLGYVLFMGFLIAIMTQWLYGTMRRLESGLAPISMRGHVVILGWTNRTVEIVGDLLEARGRLDRFLARNRRRRLRIVVVADEVDSERRARLRTELGPQWRNRQIFLRAGSSFQYVDLLRFDLRRAAAIVVPGDEFEFGGEDGSDTRAVTTLHNLRRILDLVPEADRPTVVAEVFDPRREPIARAGLQGVQVVPGEAIIARLIAQTIRDARLAPIFLELLSPRRNSSPFVRRFPELAGHHPLDVEDRFPTANVIGAVRKERGVSVAHLHPPRDFRLDSEDQLAFIAPNYTACAIGSDEPADPPEPIAPTRRQPSGTRRILILGWSRKVGVILEEIGAQDAGSTEVTLVSRVPPEIRMRDLQEHTIDTERVRIEHVERDYTGAGMFAAVDPEAFDTVVYLASTRLPDHDQADARTILGYGLLRSVLDERGVDGARSPTIVVEFVNAANGELYPRSKDVILVSPTVLAFLQTHVALRSELNTVFQELIAPGGAQVAVRTAEEYGLAGRTFRYGDVVGAARARGEVALGVLSAPGEEVEVQLSPSGDQEWSSSDTPACIVLAREETR